MAMKKLKPIVVGGFCKSGTTAIIKCLAYCLNIEWQNEIREVWHLDRYAANKKPQKEIQTRLRQNKEDRIIIQNLKNKKLIKFPQAVYVPDLIVPRAYLVVVVRHPADTICAFLEREYKFKSLKFPWSKIQTMSERWNYAYLSLQFVSPSRYCLIRYEDFVLCPTKTIVNVCDFVDKKQKRAIPEWNTKQALPYFNFDKKGRPIRGIGRSELSLTKNQISHVLKICQPAIKFLANSNPDIIDYLK